MTTRLFGVRVKRIDLVDRPAIRETAVLFKQEPRTAYEAIEAAAPTVRKASPALSPEQAFAKVYKARPDLRRAYEAEEAERKVRQLGER